MIYWILTGFILLVLIRMILFIPKRWSVSQTVLVQTSTEQLYNDLSTIKNWKRWQMESEEEEIDLLYIGPEKGEGASVYWNADGNSAGLRIYRCVHLRTIHYFMKINASETLLYFKYELFSLGEVVKVAWVCEGTSKNALLSLIYRWGVRREMKKALEKLSEVYFHEEKSLQTA
ncbi:hypothetical protein AWM68_11975 [Fictibacillus phosphorivorans]|uniref:Polyketide cyclase n=1 Tax=Fictibacillus phosphorivorans TaxID=1221500 RepID=A0A165MXM2_9BACL|nr:hypothetical protein [Fictibacillus phosphorivorans]KZE63827.1 hypothetical protein AWM68_11975 [Fictibacillus phosphorivorans]